MKYHINRTENYSLATIIPDQSETVTALITVDIHTARNVAVQATELMYADALLSGTKSRSREAFLHAVNLLGATLSVSCAHGALTITLKSTASTFTKLLKLVDEMLSAPVFSKPELARIRQTTTNELHDAKEDSRSAAHAGLLNTMYGTDDRKFSYEIDDTIAALAGVTAKKLLTFHQAVFTTSWTCSIAAEASTCAAFEKTIQRLKKGEQANVLIGAHTQKPPRQKVILKHIAGRQNIDFSIGAPLPFTLHHPDYIPLVFGVAVLAKWGGFAGRLMSTVREQEGLTYGIYGHLDGFSGTEQGYWRIMTFFAPDKALQGLTSTFREITKIYQEGITEDDLARFKTILGTQQTLLKDSLTGQLRDLHGYHCHQFTLEEMKQHKARINTLTVKEVNEAIQTYLNPANLTISGAGPVKTVQKDITAFIKTVT